MDPDRPRLGQTPWQTLGPFFHHALAWPGAADLVGRPAAGARADLIPVERLLLAPAPRVGLIAGEAIEILGRVTDGAGEPVSDALVEIWQANALGAYDADGRFPHFGRAASADDGEFHFRTILPGRVAGPGNTRQAAHIAVGVLGRGLVKRLVTRLYFEGEPGLDEDPILALAPKDRRATLIARRSGPVSYRFDIVLQGVGETVFFDC